MRTLWMIIAVLVGVSACASTAEGPPIHGTNLATISQRLLSHVSVLAADDFEGRAPGTPGDRRTVSYIADQFREIGLQPWRSTALISPVPLRRMSAHGSLTARSSTRAFALDPRSDVAVQITAEEIDLSDRAVLFAGYGIIAPEFSRDDYAGVDVTDRVVIVLAGEPPALTLAARSHLPAAAMEPLQTDPRTLHRWTWMKQHRAMERGARAVFIVSPDAISGSRRQFFEQEYVLVDQASAWAPPVSGLISGPAFERLAQLAGTSEAELRRLAAAPDFRARELVLELTGHVSASPTPLLSANVVGAIHGTEPGCVILTAHWDGYGTDPSTTPDGIWNGAVDDAGGVAQLIEVMRLLATGPSPRRSIVGVATTGEERGFLGARHFLETVGCDGNVAAVLNLDWFYELGRTQRLVSHGLGYASLDLVVEQFARRQRREVTAVNAYFAGGDQLPFLFAGIPGFHGGSFGPPIERGAGFEEDYYHRRDVGAVFREGNSNKDEVSPEWNLGGAAEDVELITDMARTIANAASEPCWTTISSFSTPDRLCH